MLALASVVAASLPHAGGEAVGTPRPELGPFASFESRMKGGRWGGGRHRNKGKVGKCQARRTKSKLAKASRRRNRK